jgi:tRNA(His) 5'-end guanylyltransferase
MANDEMHLIREDRWLPSLWGDDVSIAEERNASSQDHQLKLYFYFGESDYWVDSSIRDALIAQRSKRNDSSSSLQTTNLPSMKISKHPEIPHTFSLDDRHMRIVAEEVAEYLREIRRRVFA